MVIEVEPTQTTREGIPFLIFPNVQVEHQVWVLKEYRNLISSFGSGGSPAP